MMDDEIKKMRGLQTAAEDAAKLYRLRTNEELRLADWQREFDRIKALMIPQRIDLRDLMPIRVDDELRRLREAFEPSPTVMQMARGTGEERKGSEREMSVLRENLLSPAVLAGFTTYTEMLTDVRRQATEIASFTRIPQFATGLIAPAEQYGRFLREVTTALGLPDIDPAMTLALEGSLVLADDVIRTNARIVSAIPSNIAEAPGSPALSRDALVLPFVQRDELVAARDGLLSLEVDDLSAHSPAHVVAQRANAIVQAIYDVNTARKLKQEPETFSHTNRSFLAARDIVLLVVRDARSFADFMDTLYVLLYEAAGDDHLRYLTSQGGELEEEECQIVWIVKHLRQYAHHDLDHGKPKDVRKKWRDLDADLRQLGFAKMPTTEPEFRRLQARLLEMTAQFLTTIVNRIS